MVDLDAVGRGEDPAALGGDPSKLPHGRRRLVTVLQHLGGQDDVEAGIVDWHVLDRPEELRDRGLDDVDADVRPGDLGEERKVRLQAAADVQHAEAPGGCCRRSRLVAEPGGQVLYRTSHVADDTRGLRLLSPGQASSRAPMSDDSALSTRGSYVARAPAGPRRPLRL